MRIPTQLLIILAGLGFSLSLATDPKSIIQPGGCYRLEGKAIGEEGAGIPGVEIRLLDASGKQQGHVFSDIQGHYRFPLLMCPADEATSLSLEATHLHFRPYRLDQVFSGAGIGLPDPGKYPADSLTHQFALTKAVRRDLVLKKSQGTSQFPGVDSLDPSYLETFFREGLILSAQNRYMEAARMMKIYAQIGKNPREIERAIRFLENHDK